VHTVHPSALQDLKAFSQFKAVLRWRPSRSNCSRAGWTAVAWSALPSEWPEKLHM